MNEPGDDELQALFARQRSTDHQRAPGFGTMRARGLKARTTGSSGLASLALWAGCGVAALALGLAAILADRPPAQPLRSPRELVARELRDIDLRLQRDLAAQQALTAWQAPTDFLLHPTPNQAHP